MIGVIDPKYFFAYVGSALAFLGLIIGGLWTWGLVCLAFVLIPIAELFSKPGQINLSLEAKEARRNVSFYDWLLYLHVPLLYGAVWLYLQGLHHHSTQFELVGMTLSMGVFVGAFGINVAHELGHRRKLFERTLAKVLLLPALYLHFYVEHNRGHHRYVATRKDPATARLGENVYTFWVRSLIMSYLSAWKIEQQRLNQQGHSFFSWQNQMLAFTLVQLIYLAAIFMVWGLAGLLFGIVIATLGVLLLESINYIEHYGLRRRRQDNGRFEKVGARHSWDSDYLLGRIFLYELTRHANHHEKASVKYQLLDYFPDAPQMPTGYPGMILLSLLPPVFFRVMNKRVPADMKMP